MHVCSEKERIVYQTQSVCKSLLVDDTILEPSLTPAALHIIGIKLLITITVKVKVGIESSHWDQQKLIALQKQLVEKRNKEILKHMVILPFQAEHNLRETVRIS